MTKGKFNVFEFLKEYQNYPCLWDKSHNNYKIKAERNSALQMILPISGLADINELKRKIRILRCTYNQELVKMKTVTKRNSIYKPKLAWFEFAHSFLNKNVEDNEKNETNLVLNVTESVDTTSEESYDFSQTLPFLTQCQYDENERTIPTKLNNQQNLSSSINDAVKALKCAYSDYHESTSNEFHIFGKHVAVQLEKLPLEESLKLQIEIQNLLTQARLRTMHCIQ